MTSLGATTTVVFAGGGTGGHLYPALAIANRLAGMLAGTTELHIHFVGTKRGLEYRQREQLGYPLHLINIRGISRSLSLKNLLLPLVVVGALVRATILLKHLTPNLVVGTGGYVAWPVLRTAAALNIPFVMQEQNSYPGIVTRRLAARAARIYLGFDKARQYLPSEARLVVSGNPVRSAINKGERAEAIREFGLDPSKRTILVLGGSQGARAINGAVVKSLKNNPLGDKYQLLWQTGKRDYKDVTSEVGNRVPGCALFPFAENMECVYAAADIAIARAGALTLAELQACRIPAVLVPFPFAAEDHQRKNAQTLVDRGAAVLIDERELERRDLIAETVALLQSNQYEQMGTAMAATAPEQPAADVIVADIIQLLGQPGKDGHNA